MLIEAAPGSRRPRRPSPVSISVPPPPDPAKPETKVTITLTSDDLKDLRLYHNDVLIPCGWDAKKPGRRPSAEIEVPVDWCRNGTGFTSWPARRAPTTVVRGGRGRLRGPVEPGQLHVVALGVGDYQKRRLQYCPARRGAAQRSLPRRGLDARAIGTEVLTARRRGDPEERRTRRSTRSPAGRGSTQDTVVVFIAGHTGVFQGQRFCLLLPPSPSPRTQPILVGAARSRRPTSRRKPRSIPVRPAVFGGRSST